MGRASSAIRSSVGTSGPKLLITPKAWSPVRVLLTRLLVVILLFCLLFSLLWADRDGLRDQSDGEISFSDIVYFTMITVSTVGYGDHRLPHLPSGSDRGNATEIPPRRPPPGQD